MTFDGHESSDPDGTIASYGWKFGDAATGTGEVTHHTYAKKGAYNITLTVKDNEGASGTETKTLVVNGKPQKVTIESEPPSPAIAGESYAVAASASSNLPVTIESPTPAVCSVSGSTVEMSTEGTCTLVFSQSGKNFLCLLSTALVMLPFLE